MPSEVVVDIPVDGAHPLRECGQRPGPGFDLSRAIHLDSGKINDVAILAHPPDVRKVGGGPVGKQQHGAPRNPSPVDEREGHAVFGEQREQSLVNPATLPKLDGEPDVAGQRREKGGHGRQLRRAEFGSELDEHWSQFRSQLPGHGEEALGQIGAAPQPMLVRDLLRQLERELEISAHARRPAANGPHTGNRVERGVDLDGVESARVGREEIGRFRAVRIKRPDPGIVVPALGSEANRLC